MYDIYYIYDICASWLDEVYDFYTTVNTIWLSFMFLVFLLHNPVWNILSLNPWIIKFHTVVMATREELLNCHGNNIIWTDLLVDVLVIGLFQRKLLVSHVCSLSSIIL